MQAFGVTQVELVISPIPSFDSVVKGCWDIVIELINYTIRVSYYQEQFVPHVLHLENVYVLLGFIDSVVPLYAPQNEGIVFL